MSYWIIDWGHTLELPELHALVNTIALMMCGTIFTLERLAAITNGDWAAVPVLLRSILSLEGTSRVIMKTDMTGTC